MDIRKVKKLIEMLEESQLNEIEIKEGEESVKLVKAISVPVQEQIVTSNAVAPAPLPAVENDNVSADSDTSQSAEDETISGQTIDSQWLELFMQRQIQEQKTLYRLAIKFQREMFFVSLKL